jgi:hypothetical protein
MGVKLTELPQPRKTSQSPGAPTTSHLHAVHGAQTEADARGLGVEGDFNTYGTMDGQMCRLLEFDSDAMLETQTHP